MTPEQPDDFADVRRLLDAAPAPPVRPVDPAAIYRDAHDRQVRVARRWRRAAIGGSVVAASLLAFALLPKLEVKAGDGAFVVRWGGPAPVPVPAPAPTPILPPAPVPAPPPDPTILARLSALEERSRVLADYEKKWKELEGLIVTVAADVDDRDARQKEQLAALQKQLHTFEVTTREQLRQTEQSQSALYAAIFDPSRRPGGNP